VTVLASPNLSNEALWLLSRIVKKSGGRGVFRVPQGSEAPLPGVEDLALRADRAANGSGAELFGFSRSDSPLSQLPQGDALLIADQDLTPADIPHILRASAVVVVSTTMPAGLERAHVVLPICNIVEEEGTLTNLRGRVQRFLQAKAAPGHARPSWYALSDLCNALGETANYFGSADVFTALAAAHPDFAGMSYASIGLKGATVASGAKVGIGGTG
jgi:NADH-quinone oxidoreductase subunit G